MSIFKITVSSALLVAVCLVNSVALSVESFVANVSTQNFDEASDIIDDVSVDLIYAKYNKKKEDVWLSSLDDTYSEGRYTG